MIILVSLVFLGRTSLKLTQAIIALLSVLVVCACTVGGERGRDSQATQYTPLEGLCSQERLKAVLFLLQAGEPLPAREELLIYLEQNPKSEVGRDLLRQIDMSADDYFPQTYREIRLTEGESLSTLSRDYLGSLYKFHALAKYNGVSEPRSVRVGQTIRIPMTDHAREVFSADAPASQSISTPHPPDEPAESGGAVGVVDSPSVQRPTAGTKPVIPETDSSLAQVETLHREALDAYRAQDLDKAIQLWDEVLRIDPDYERARLYRSQAAELREKLTRIN